ncbi:MAG: pilus assembly protein N-terminal domain-containing protein, partial [Gemmataceae bacterium]|nr:pilus assembly protein N-terminal domain-containing protein [Gemmataceae bacterium]
MHRTKFVARLLGWSCLLGMLLQAAVSSVEAQAPDQLPQLPGFVQEKQEKEAKQEQKKPEQPPKEEGPAAEDVVLVVPIGTTKTVQMSSKEVISVVSNENPKVARVQTIIENPRAVLITGLTPGTTRVTLTDAKKRSESFEVRVPSGEAENREQKRKELLEYIRKAVPTAAVEVLPAPGDTTILSGTVSNAESVTVIMDLARSIFGGNVVNALRIGGVQQVQLEVVVAVVNRSEVRRIGFTWFVNGKDSFFASVLTSPLNLTNSITPGIGAAAAAVTGSPNLFFGTVNDSSSFAGFLQALRTEGIAKVLSEPKVTTLSGRPAFIVSGGETPILTSSGQGAPSIQYKRFGTVVTFLPIVLGNGKIHLEVRPELSQVNNANGINIPGLTPTIVPGFDTRSTEATVVMEDGQTMAIGGLIQNIVNGNTTKVPILGDLPIIGAAFRNMSYDEREEELLILVTPRLVDAMACTQLPKYFPGRETRSPDDFELFLEGILEAP